MASRTRRGSSNGNGSGYLNGPSGQVYVVSAARSPVGKFGGSLADTPATTLGGVAIRAAVERAGIPTDPVEVLMGQVIQGGAGQAPARKAALKAGLHDTTSATTINRVCGSGSTSSARPTAPMERSSRATVRRARPSLEPLAGNQSWAARIAATPDGFVAVNFDQNGRHGSRWADGVDWAAETGFPSVSGLIDDHALDVFADAERLVVVGWGEAPTALGSGLSFSMVGPPTAP